MLARAAAGGRAPGDAEDGGVRLPDKRHRLLLRPARPRRHGRRRPGGHPGRGGIDLSGAGVECAPGTPDPVAELTPLASTLLTLQRPAIIESRSSRSPP